MCVCVRERKVRLSERVSRCERGREKREGKGREGGWARGRKGERAGGRV